jgi:hypothetical protein
VAPRFAALPARELEIVRPFIRSDEPYTSRTGTTWFTETACLGTVDYAGFWTQRRPLIAYWQTGEGPPAVLRMRFLHDGKDFASVCGHHVQTRNRVLSALGLLTNRGDWHHHLDRPADGVFRATDLRMRYELTAEGASAEQLAGDWFELAAGRHRAVVHTLPGVFDAWDATWEMGQEDGKAYVDGICYRGPERDFDLGSVSRMEIGASLEILPLGQMAVDWSPKWGESDGDSVELRWDEAALALSVPVRPHPSG